jgi:hypothetical protein
MLNSLSYRLLLSVKEGHIKWSLEAALIKAASNTN